MIEISRTGKQLVDALSKELMRRLTGETLDEAEDWYLFRGELGIIRRSLYEYIGGLERQVDGTAFEKLKEINENLAIKNITLDAGKRDLQRKITRMKKRIAKLEALYKREVKSADVRIAEHEVEVWRESFMALLKARQR